MQKIVGLTWFEFGIEIDSLLSLYSRYSAFNCLLSTAAKEVVEPLHVYMHKHEEVLLLLLLL